MHVNLPGQVHRYAAGHRIELVLASTDSAYVGSRVPQAITVAADPAHPAVLTLPIDPQSVVAPGPSVPEVGRAAGLPLVAAPVGLVAMRWRRRQRGQRVSATG